MKDLSKKLVEPVAHIHDLGRKNTWYNMKDIKKIGRWYIRPCFRGC